MKTKLCKWCGEESIVDFCSEQCRSEHEMDTVECEAERQREYSEMEGGTY